MMFKNGLKIAPITKENIVAFPYHIVCFKSEKIVIFNHSFNKILLLDIYGITDEYMPENVYVNIKVDHLNVLANEKVGQSLLVE